MAECPVHPVLEPVKLLRDQQQIRHFVHFEFILNSRGQRVAEYEDPLTLAVKLLRGDKIKRNENESTKII